MLNSPLVHQSQTHLLRTFQTDKLIQLWRENLDTDISGELSGIKEIRLNHCEKSQLDFFTPFSAEGSEKLYHQMQKFDWFYMKDKWEFAEALKDLKACQTILEVGCGPGYFIEQVQAKQKSSNMKGIELNSSILEQALEKNLPVECVDLNELVVKGEMFDAVCSFQVLEHTSHPRELIEAMVKVLKPDGKLIVSVPNKESFLRYQYNLLDMQPHHMTRWCISTLKYLEKIFFLFLIHTKFEPLANYHISGYMAAYEKRFRNRFPILQKLLPDSRLRNFSSFLEKSSLYHLLRGQSLYVVFEKL